MKSWILLTEGQSGRSRATLAAARALGAAGYLVTVTRSGELSLAAASKGCARTVDVPSADEPGYREAIEAELERKDYLATFPTSDAAIEALQGPGSHLLDKAVWQHAARSAGLSVPETSHYDSLDELRAAGSQLDYPVVVKPTTKRFLATRASSSIEIGRITGEGPVLVQPFIGDRLRAVYGLMWRGALHAAVHQRYERVWPTPCGTVSSAWTTEPDVGLESKLESFLAGYEGLFHVEFAGDYLIDVNPRVHALTRLATASGCDPVVTYCDLLRGLDAPRCRGRSGIFYRWTEGDMRSVLKSWRDENVGGVAALRALIPHRGAAHSFELSRDPKPVLQELRFLRRDWTRWRARRNADGTPVTEPRP